MMPPRHSRREGIPLPRNQRIGTTPRLRFKALTNGPRQCIVPYQLGNLSPFGGNYDTYLSSQHEGHGDLDLGLIGLHSGWRCDGGVAVSTARESATHHQRPSRLDGRS